MKKKDLEIKLIPVMSDDEIVLTVIKLEKKINHLKGFIWSFCNDLEEVSLKLRNAVSED